MGTRGAYGFRSEGKDYLTYNHFDSYPSGLGDDLASQIRAVVASGTTVETLRQQVRDMRVIVRDDEQPTDEERAKFGHLWSNVSNGHDWYSLLREMQGDMGAHLKEGVMIDGNAFIMDSLFCEYAYILNLDDETFEVYQGFQRTLHNDGRYGGEVPDPEPYPSGHMPDKYYGCRLVATFPMAAIPEDWIDQAFPEDKEEEDAA